MLMDHAFVPSDAANPRLARCCGKCSRIPEVHMQGRDEHVEHAFMADVSELVQQMRGMSYNPTALAAYRRKVSERLAVGAERYGPIEFLNRDNLREVEEETPDVATYGLLEVERLERAGFDEEALAEVRSALVTAAAYAAVADEWVRVARAARMAA